MNSSSPEPHVARVAIVVTCFNSGETLPETIASIESCGTPVELVVVDDGSSEPHTEEVLLRLEAEGVRVIRQANLGQAAATNAGTAATAAPYVMRFDSDDTLEAGALEDLVMALDETPHAAAAWGDFQTFGETTFVVPGAQELDPWLITYVNLVPGSGTLLRRSALEATGGWRLPTGFEDWDLWMTFAERGYRGIYVPRTVFRYRRHHTSRQARARLSVASYYDSLIRTHSRLVRTRRHARRHSPAPNALKLLIPAVEALPCIQRRSKITLCELLARLLWSSRPRETWQMARQGIKQRLRTPPPSG